jgi:hypothetical protein
VFKVLSAVQKVKKIVWEVSSLSAQVKQHAEAKTPRLDKILDRWEDDEFIVLEDRVQYDHCLVGVVERFGMSPVLCYDYDKVIAMHVKEGMTREEAVEYFDFNTIGAWMGDRTPVFITKP